MTLEISKKAGNKKQITRGSGCCTELGGSLHWECLIDWQKCGFSPSRLTTAQRSICPNTVLCAPAWVGTLDMLDVRRICVSVNKDGNYGNYASIKQHHNAKLLKITHYLPQLFPCWPLWGHLMTSPLRKHKPHSFPKPSAFLSPRELPQISFIAGLLVPPLHWASQKSQRGERACVRGTTSGTQCDHIRQTQGEQPGSSAEEKLSVWLFMVWEGVVVLADCSSGTFTVTNFPASDWHICALQVHSPRASGAKGWGLQGWVFADHLQSSSFSSAQDWHSTKVPEEWSHSAPASTGSAHPLPLLIKTSLRTAGREVGGSLGED